MLPPVMLKGGNEMVEPNVSASLVTFINPIKGNTRVQTIDKVISCARSTRDQNLQAPYKAVS